MPDSDHRRTRTFRTVAPETSAGERLDRFIGHCEAIPVSRSRAQRLIDDGLVLVDGAAVAAKYSLAGGERIEVTVPPAPAPSVSGEAIPLDVVYEDDYLAVINKPPGMVTHPAAGNHSGTLVNALVHRFGRLAGSAGADRPGIVHRLDKDTSGLLVAARRDEAFAALQKMIADRRLTRIYLAVVCGHMPDDAGEIDAPIGRSTRDRKRMAVTGVASRPARTYWRRLERYRSYDFLEVTLQTGRTHQIRVHFSHLGHPVFGDPKYGGREKWLRGMFGPERPLGRRLLGMIKRQCLHAARLEFEHPMTGERLALQAVLPTDFAEVLAVLRAPGRV